MSKCSKLLAMACLAGFVAVSLVGAADEGLAQVTRKCEFKKDDGTVVDLSSPPIKGDSNAASKECESRCQGAASGSGSGGSCCFTACKPIPKPPSKN